MFTIFPRFLVFLLLSLLLTSVAAATQTLESILPEPLITGQPQLPGPIHTVVINGNVNVVVRRGGRSRDNYQAEGLANPFFQSRYVGNTLYLQVVRPPGRLTKQIAAELVQPVEVSVVVQSLNRIIAEGMSSITATNLRTPSLSIFGHTGGRIDLRGAIGLRELVTLGPAQVTIIGVRSPTVEVHNFGGARISLVGAAARLDARVSGQGYLHANDLPVQDAFLQVDDAGQISVRASHYLNAFAYDRGIITYFSAPAHMNEFSQQSGNILQGE